MTEPTAWSFIISGSVFARLVYSAPDGQVHDVEYGCTLPPGSVMFQSTFLTCQNCGSILVDKDLAVGNTLELATELNTNHLADLVAGRGETSKIEAQIAAATLSVMTAEEEMDNAWENSYEDHIPSHIQDAIDDARQEIIQDWLSSDEGASAKKDFLLEEYGIDEDEDEDEEGEEI